MFSYPLDLLASAAQLYESTGKVPSIAEAMYHDNSWVAEVMIYSEGWKWAADIQDD